jgi:pre-rRNA-processing protein TSR3
MNRPFIVALRHVKEKRSKCSLVGVEALPGTFFRRAKPGFSYDGTGHVLLNPDAPEISPSDAFLTTDEEGILTPSGRAQLVLRDASGRALRPVLLLDSVWRLLPSMRAKVTGTPVERSLPGWVSTAYPRISKMTDDPERGLATVEALYAALALMGFEDGAILNGYRWKDEFLAAFREGMSCNSKVSQNRTRISSTDEQG